MIFVCSCSYTLHSLFLFILWGPSARLGMAMVDVSERVIGFLV